MNNNEILKSLEEEKTKLESDFTIYTGQLKQLEENMASVEQEYRAKRENLEVNIERVRGAYKVVYDQLKKFGAIKEEMTVEEVKQEEPYLTDTETTIKKETKKEPVKVKTNKKVEKKEEVKEKVVAGLTPEEIEKINKAVAKPNNKDTNGNEIPEYLQTEYNK